MISPLAHVDPAAKIGSNVTIHPFAYIEADVEIGDDKSKGVNLDIVANLGSRVDMC